MGNIQTGIFYFLTNTSSAGESVEHDHDDKDDGQGGDEGRVEDAVAGHRQERAVHVRHREMLSV